MNKFLQFFLLLVSVTLFAQKAPEIGESTSDVAVKLAPTDYRIYVKPNGKGDGSSWEQAVDLADALYWIEKIDRGNEDRNKYSLWVAKGTYFPRFDLKKAHLNEEVDKGSIYQTFYIDFDVAIYGGFNGTETLLDQRNWYKNETILSGDINDSHTVEGYGGTLKISNGNKPGTERITHVRPVNKVVFDGLIFYGAYTTAGITVDNDFYGNVNVEKGSPSINVYMNVMDKHPAEIIIAHCKMHGNYSERSGGAINLDASSLTWTIIDTEISRNYTNNNGGALDLENGVLYLYNSTLAGNNSKDSAGGIRLNGSSISPGTVTIYNSIIYDNYCRSTGSIVTDNIALNTNVNLSTGNSIIGKSRNANSGNKPVDIKIGKDLGGNSFENPMFTKDNTDDKPYYSIQEDKSPAFNTGNTEAYASFIDKVKENGTTIVGKDLAFNKRYGKKKISMGAYEAMCPTIDAPQVKNTTLTYTYKEKANALVASGDKLVWYAGDATGDVDYDTASEKAPTPNTSVVGTQKYFVRVELENGCESEFTEITVVVNPGQIKVVAKAASKYYGEEDPVFTYSATGLPSGVSLTGQLTREPGEYIGTFAILADALSAPENYVITFTGSTFEIKKGTVKVTVPNDSSKYFGEADPVFDYTVAPIEGVYTAEGIQGELQRAAGENAGVYAYTSDGLQSINDEKGTPVYNIQVDLSHTFEIKAAELTILPAAQLHKIYGEKDPFLSYTVQVNQGVIDFPLDAAVLMRKAGEAAETYPITMKEGYSYPNTKISVTSGQLFTIQQRAITLTGDNITRGYGQKDPALTVQITQGTLVEGDAITGVPERAPGENKGTYAINKGTVGISNNYTIEFVPGVFEITPEEIVIKPDGLQKIYGDIEPDLTYEIATGELYFGDKFEGALEREPGEDVGSYSISQGDLRVSDNYNITVNPGNFAISSALLTVTPEQLTKTFGEKDPEVFTYDASGFKFTDNENLMSGALVRAKGENVGDYEILKGDLKVDSNNYLLQLNKKFFTITSADISGVSLSSEEFTYVEKVEQKLVVKGSLPDGAEVKYTYRQESETGAVVAQPIYDAGVYYVTAEVTAANYNALTLTATMTVSQAEISGLELAGKSFTYNGKSHQLTVTGTQKGDEITYDNNDKTDVGTYTVTATVHRSANYIDAVLSNDLVIIPAEISGVSFLDSEVIFDGTPKQLVVSGTKDGDQVTYVYKDSKGQLVAQNEVIAADIYNVTATIVRNNNYVPLVKQAKLTIKLGAIDNIEFTSKTFVYDGEVHTLEVTGNLPNGAEVDIVYENANGAVVKEPIDASSYTATATIKAENFETLVLNANLVIQKATIVDLEMTGRNEEYEGNPLCLTVKGENLLETDAVTYVYKDASGTEVNECPVDVGEYTVVATVKRDDNYEVATLEAKLIITPAPIQGLRLDDTSFVYDGTSKSLIVQDEAGNVVTDGVTFEENSQKDAGDYEVKAIVNKGPNYKELTLVGTLTITPRALIIKANNKSKRYGNADPNLTITVTGLVEGDALEGEVVREPGENAGDYPITQGTLVASKNYTVTFTDGKFTIRQVRVTVTAENQTKVYGETDPIFTYTFTGIVNNESPEEVFSGELNRLPLNNEESNTVVLEENVGTYVINQGTLQTNDNYTLRYVTGGVLKITPAPLKVSANAQTKIYGEKDPALTYTVEGLVNGDVENKVIDGFVTRVEGENVGTYKISQGTLAGGNNYSIDFTENNLEITAKTLSVAAVAQTKDYGAADPVLSYTATGFALNDNASVLTGSLLRKKGEDVGEYDINQGDLKTNNNYTIAYTKASLVIGQKALKVTAEPKSKLYGGNERKLTYRTEGLVNGDVLTGALSRVVGEDVGDYEIQQGSLVSTINYKLTFEKALYSITPATLIVTGDHKEKEYGEEDPIFTYQLKGLVNNDSANEVLSGTLERINTSNTVGEYVITQGSLAVKGKNYILEYAEGSLTIKQAPLKIIANPITVVYGEEIPALSYEIEGELKYKDEVTGSLVREEGTGVDKYLISQGTLAVNDNYAITYEDAYLTITQMQLEVTAQPQTKVYGEQDPSLAYTLTKGTLADPKDLTGALVRVEGENVGAYRIREGSLKATSNYNLSYVADSLRITPKTIKVVVDAQTKTYGDEDPALTYQVADNALVGDDTLEGSLHRTPGEDVDLYSILQGDLVDPSKNYVIDYIGANLEIQQRAIEITADDKGKILGAEDPALTYTITKGVLVKTDSITGDLVREPGEGARTYEIAQGTLAISAPGNYDLTFVEGSFVISERKLVIKAKDTTKVYGQEDPVFEYEITSGTLLPNDTLEGELSREGDRNVGKYPINLGTLKAPEGYNVDFDEGVFTITEAPITISADAKTKVYGAEDPQLTFSYDSTELFYGEKIDGALYRDAQEDIGTYEIKGDSLSINENYTINYLPENLEITPATLTIVPDALTKVYNTADPKVYTYQSGGFVFEDGISLLSGALTRAKGEGVAKYIIEIGDLTVGSANYTLSLSEEYFTITPATISGVSLDSKTFTYDTNEQKIEVSGTLPEGATVEYAYYAGSQGGTVVAQPITNVGTYYVTAVVTAENYTDLTLQATMTVSPAEMIGLELPGKEVTYTGEVQSLKVINTEEGDTVTYENNDQTTVGTYVVSAKVHRNDNYNDAVVTGELSILQATIEGVRLLDDEEIFDGTPKTLLVAGDITPEDTVTYVYKNGDGVVVNEMVDAGTYEVTATVERNENYKVLSLKATLTITLADADGIAFEAKTVIYTGTPFELEVTAKNPELLENAKIEIVYTNAQGDVVEAPTDAGVYNAKATVEIVNYAPKEFENTLTIEQAEIKGLAMGSRTELYEGKPLCLTVTGKNLQNTDTVTYVYRDELGNALEGCPINVGTYTVEAKVERNANYKIAELTGTVEITPAPIEGVYLDEMSVTYDGQEHSLVVDDHNNNIITEGVVFKNNGQKDVGVYSVEATVSRGKNYLERTLTGTLTIVERKLTVTAAALTKVYGSPEPLLTYSVDGLVAGESLQGELSREEGEDVGVYTISQGTVKASDNYLLTFVPSSLTITKAQLIVTAVRAHKVYGTEDPQFTYNVKGLVRGDTAETVLTGKVARNIGENVGTYTIHVGDLKANGNYTMRFVTGLFAITPAEVKVIANAQTKVYGDTDPALSYQAIGLVNNDVEEKVFDGILERAKGEDVGTYAISQGSLAAGNNYTIVYTGNDFVITPKELTITANPQTKVYGGREPYLSYVASGFTGNDDGDSLTGSLERVKGENVDIYKIEQGSLKATTNYTVNYIGDNFTITKKNLEVIADDKVKTYGANDPLFTYRTKGIVTALGDTVESVLEGTLTRAPGEAVGTYAIEQGSVSSKSQNYDLIFTPGELRIASSTLVVQARNATKVYGGIEPELSYDIVSGEFAEGDEFTGSIVRAEGENVGLYAIMQGSLKAPDNYEVIFRSASFTITPAELTIAINGKVKFYGEDDPEFDYVIDSGNLVEGDEIIVEFEREEGEDIGNYIIKESKVEVGANYTYSVDHKSLEILPLPITVAADTQTKVYGEKDPSLTYAITENALVGEDTLTGVLTRKEGENIGRYAIAQGSLQASKNYVLTYQGADLEITPQTLEVTANEQTKVYGKGDPALTYTITKGDLVGKDVLTGALTREVGEDVGAYAITQGSLKANANYAFTYKGADLTITPQVLVVTADTQTKVYGENDPALTYKITTGNLVGKDVLSGTLTREVGENVGTYAIAQGSLKASANYAFTYQGADLTITPQNLVVTANTQTKVYGETDPALTYKLSQGALIGEDVLTGALTRKVGENAGSYAIEQGTLKASTNYAFTYQGADLTITPKAIVVTAKEQTKVYGDKDPILTYELSKDALVGTDVLTGSLTRQAGENIGKYVIDKGSLKATPNYTMKYVSAKLTITPRTLVITADAQTKVYGTKDPVLSYAITEGALVGKDGLTGRLTRVAGENVGAYAIEQGTLGASINYTVAYKGADLTIVKANQTMKFDKVKYVTLEDTPKLQLNANASSNLPVVYTYKNMVPEDMAQGTKTGEVTLYKTGQMDVVATQEGNANYSSVTATQTLIVQSRDTAIYQLEIDGEVYEDIDPVVLIPYNCRVNDGEIVIKVTVNDEATVSPSPLIKIPVVNGQPSQKEVTVTVTAQNGKDTATYTIKFDVSDDTSNVLQMKYNNLIFVNNNPETNGGFKFKAFKIYENGVLIADKQVYSAGENIEVTIKEDALYHAELVLEDGTEVMTCPKTFDLLRSFTINVYPNPVPRNGDMTIKFDYPTEGFGQAEYFIYSLKGQVVDRGILRETLSKIRIKASLPTGAYFLVLKHQNKHKAINIIVKD